MKRKFRLGGVGLGHRGRSMLKWANDGIDSFEAVATCDLDPDGWLTLSFFSFRH